jgi:salicylate hydroxylase
MTGRTTDAPRIAILGGGIGGLAAAAFLRREGADPA